MLHSIVRIIIILACKLAKQAICCCILHFGYVLVTGLSSQFHYCLLHNLRIMYL